MERAHQNTHSLKNKLIIYMVGKGVKLNDVIFLIVHHLLLLTLLNSAVGIQMFCLRLFVVVYKLVLLMLCCYGWIVCILTFIVVALLVV